MQYRSISAENSTDSYTYTSAPMTSTTAAGGAEDCVAVEAHPAVLTATAVEAYAFDSNSGAGSGKDAKDKDVKEKGTFASKPTGKLQCFFSHGTNNYRDFCLKLSPFTIIYT